MVAKEAYKVAEPHLYQIHHQDGNLSIIGDTRGVQTHRPLAFRNSSVPISEADFVAKMDKASLPLQRNAANIIGWGGDSVCIRVGEEKDRFAVVLRSNREPGNWQSFLNHWKREQEANLIFHRYTFPEALAVVNGVDNQPAVMKIAREVPGATLSEVSAMYLLLNKRVIGQYLDWSKTNLIRFLYTGIITDPIGHTNSNVYKSLFEKYGLFLFDASNLMINFQNNDLVMVDSESDDIRIPPLHRKVQLVSRAVGMGISIGVLEILKGLHKVHDRFFPDSTEKEYADKTPGAEELKKGFADTISLLDASGLNYRIVGSFATAATINALGGNYYLTPFRRDRTIRDIDVIVLDDDQLKIEQVSKEINSRRKQNPFYPSVAIFKPRIFDGKNGYSERKATILPVLITKPAIDHAGNFYLVYEDKYTQIPKDHLHPVNQTYEGVVFPTLRAGVLAGLYLTRMGVYKSKNIEKVATLLELTKDQIPVEFLDFSKVLRTNWPILYRNFLIRELIYFFSGGLISRGIYSYITSHISNQEIHEGVSLQ